AHAQRHLAMGAAVLERVHRAAVAAVQGDPLAGERGREGLFPAHVLRYSDRVPEIRVDSDAPEIGDGLGTVSTRAVQANRRSGRQRLILGSKCLRHTLSPCAAYLIRARRIGASRS